MNKPTYDTSKYRRLEPGEQLQLGDLYIYPELDTPLPCHDLIGAHVEVQDSWTFLRPIASAIPPDVISDDPFAGIAHTIGLQTDIGRAALRIALANIQVLDKKQQDYGSDNIAAFGEQGVLVRVWDKISRLRNLLKTGNTPANESIEDSWLDLSNYAIIAVMCRRGEWK